MKIRIKICCISSVAEAKAATECGADILGLVGHMPSGPGVLPDSLIAEISRSVAPGVSSFLLSSETDTCSLINHYRRVYTSAIQIVDCLQTRSYDELKKELPAVKLIQVIHVMDEASVDEAIEADLLGADALLLDSGNPRLAVKELGGTGRTHNWKLSKKIVDAVPVPVFLAGGLNAANVAEAIQTVCPFGIDLCSSVRTDQQLDRKKLEELIAIVGRQ